MLASFVRENFSLNSTKINTPLDIIVIFYTNLFIIYWNAIVIFFVIFHFPLNKKYTITPLYLNKQKKKQLHLINILNRYIIFNNQSEINLTLHHTG